MTPRISRNLFLKLGNDRQHCSYLTVRHPYTSWLDSGWGVASLNAFSCSMVQPIFKELCLPICTEPLNRKFIEQ